MTVVTRPCGCCGRLFPSNEVGSITVGFNGTTFRFCADCRDEADWVMEEIEPIPDPSRAQNGV